MPAACSAAGDFDPGMSDVFDCLNGLLGRARGILHAMSAGHGPGARGPWSRASSRPKGSRDWTGSFGGNWTGWWPGQPGPGRGPKAARGDVRAAILALLGEGPRNGYQIMSDIEERSGGAWRPSPGAVYPALQQLADEGLIEASETAGKRTYSLTDAGRRHVEENPGNARAAWESMTNGEAGEMQGLFVQAARLGGTIVQMAHAGTPAQLRAAEAVLEHTRRQIYQILASDEAAGQDED